MATLRQVLTTAIKLGYTFNAYYDDPSEPDYVGGDVEECIEALENCDEMNLIIFDGKNKVADLFIVSDYDGDPEEQINDCTDNEFMRQFSEGVH